MEKRPYTEKLNDGFHFRKFSYMVDENELKWHWDQEDRIVICEYDTDWMIQIDNELPQKIKKNTPIFVPEGVYHRLIKGTNDVELKIKKLKDRDYVFFEIPKDNKEQEIDEHSYSGNVIIRPYNEKTDKETIMYRLEEVYHKIGYSAKIVWGLIEPIDTNLSVVVEVDGELAGFYFLRDEPIPLIGKKEDNVLSKLRGVEGVALGVFNEFKSYGIGKDLINYPKKLNFDYIWGYQLKSLQNIDDWLKRRKLYAENEQLYVTYEIFNKTN